MNKFSLFTGSILNIIDLVEPDEEIQRDGKIYLRRWHINREYGKQNVYLHEFLGNDNDKALHDHPWQSCSVVLHGEYKEYIDKHKYLIRKAGDVIFRNEKEFHRIELINNQPAYTLFITGPKVKDWGFDCENGFKHWEEFEEDGGC